MKTLTTRYTLILLLSLLPWLCGARTWSADDIPMVHLQDRTRYVCDPENLLSSQALASADSALYRLHHECGIQTVFIVVPHVKNADCFRMAQDVGNKYGVGTKKDRRGLVIVIATDDRRYFIAPGKGLEADLTDVECNDIARACIVRYMKEGDVDEAVKATSQALFSKFKTGKTGVASIDEEPESDDSWIGIILVLLICFGYPVWLILEKLGLVKPRRRGRKRRDNDDDFFPPFIFGGGGGFGSGGGISGGSFGGGSFGGGGAGGGW